MNIASHNASSGEESVGIMSHIVVKLFPDIRTQSQTMSHQYKDGSRYFDIRVRYIGGQLMLSNGLWHSRSLYEALEEMALEIQKGDHVYITVTYDRLVKTRAFGEHIRDEVFRIVSEINDLFRVAKQGTSLWLMEVDADPSNLVNIWTTTDKKPLVVDGYTCKTEEKGDSDSFLMIDYV